MTNADPMTRPAPRPRVLRGLVRLAWQQPLYAIPFAIFFGTMFARGWSGFLLSYKVSLVLSYTIGLGVWAAGTTVVRRLFRSRPDCDAPIWQVAAAYTAGSLLGAYAGGVIVQMAVLPGFLGGTRELVVMGLYTVLFCALFMAISYARVFHLRAVERARAVETIRAELAQAELRALRAQVNPHFLFNTLNSIAALIPENPKAAEETTTLLAEVFRFSLSASGREHTALGEELAFLRACLRIESTRLGARLNVREEIEPGLDTLPVPSLLLQPLVENAVRHGVAATPRGGTVRIAARREGALLHIEIADDGPGMESAPADSADGFGLRSVRERLLALGPPHSLEIDTRPGSGTRVRVTLPCEPAATTAPPPKE
ncbi:MAG: sensor histidine kinase [Candidatus Eisenbacteria bacterium]|nr:sensor histidine kinase [Candidatus Eisenbacteria bacterium]